MEASGTQQHREKDPRVHRPCAFDKMEGLVREMQDPENGVPVRSQKQFLTSIPSAFMGYDLIEWLMERLAIEESVEAVHIANQLCQYGYFFPVNDSKTLTVKDDSSLYRFQTPYYWPWQHRTPDNVEYAIYLAKRTLRNKQRHALEDYEIEALNSLRKNLQNKWDIIQLQAEEQVRLSKDRKKGDKIVSDSQERAFWRVYRPPPGCLSSLEVVPVPTRARPGLPGPPPRKRTLNDLQREVDLLRNSLTRTRIKVSSAIENLKSYFETYMEYDPMIVQPQPSNPWITDDQMFWQLNSPLVEVPTEKRVKRWALSLEELTSDPTGLQEFTNYLRKEYSHENIRFWLAVKDLRRSFQAQIPAKVNEIFEEFLAPGAPCEINIDGKTMEKVHQEMKNPSRFTFDSAAEHVYALLLKKDCYPRFVRSEHYRNLLAAGIQPMQKKRFFGFGGQAKKKTSSTTAPATGTLQQQHSTIGTSGGKRRGSDRSLSGSAHELAFCGVRDVTMTPRVPHSHSQSNLTDIPYRGDLARLVKIPSRPSPRSIQDAGGSTEAAPADDVCPWDAAPPSGPGPGPSLAPTLLEGGPDPRLQSRKNSSQLDSCSSSSDISLAVAEASDRLRRSCGLQLAAVAATPRVKLSDTARSSASMSSCTFPSPRQSFDLVNPSPSPAEAHPGVASIVLEEAPGLVRRIQPSPSLETENLPGLATTPPLVVGELEAEIALSPVVEGGLLSSPAGTSRRASEVGERKASVAEVGQDDLGEIAQNVAGVAAAEAEEVAEEAQVVPVWEPEATSAQAAAAATGQVQRDNNVNEVCPWEDEENCRVDAPYVKTYATLGYL
ncbi:regulator of G-protein signaling 7 [Orussus abietinus]|uniref:regulator of G-protein signaling 7 n=1 Tax=Orussus abietinus TaxID=222816 RepID=UPI000C7160ED|nr:regulator of G-protein signaling 7 [Orussus abietinus]